MEAKKLGGWDLTMVGMLKRIGASKWTDKEDAILAECEAKKLSLEETAELLPGRNVGSVKYRRRVLCLGELTRRRLAEAKLAEEKKSPLKASVHAHGGRPESVSGPMREAIDRRVELYGEYAMKGLPIPYVPIGELPGEDWIVADLHDEYALEFTEEAA